MIHWRKPLAAIVLTLALAAPAAAAIVPAPAAVILADTWDWEWDGFRRFWRSQMGKTTGVAGAAGIVVGIGVLIICSAKKK